MHKINYNMLNIHLIDIIAMLFLSLAIMLLNQTHHFFIYYSNMFYIFFCLL